MSPPDVQSAAELIPGRPTCRPWLDAEIQLVKPRVIVCMGATAAQALLGRTFRLTVHRGEFSRLELARGAIVTATAHPSSILRAPDARSRKLEMKWFVEDLQTAAKRLRSPAV